MDGLDPDGTLEAIAAGQHGVISRRQAHDAGLDRHQIRVRLDSGRWRTVAPRVYGFPGHPDTWPRRLWIAHLHGGPDTVISIESAARLLRLGPVEGWPVDLIVERRQGQALPGTRRYRPGDLAPNHVMRHQGLPVTTPARTIVDLAAFVSRTRLATVVETAEVERRCSLLQVATMLDDLRRSGKRGVRKLADVLDELGPGDALPRSQLERLLDRVIELAGLPPPRHEHPLPSTGALTGFVDRCWPEARLIVEADGRRWHTRRQRIALDHDRDLEASRNGYLTVRLIWERLEGDAETTARALAEIYASRLAG